MLKLITDGIASTAILTGIGACAAAPPKSGDETATVKAAIERANQINNDGRMRADAAMVVSILAPDFVSMGVDGTDIVGRAANQAAVEKMLTERKVTPVSYLAVSDTVEVFGDFAYEVGHNVNVYRASSAVTARSDTV